MKLADVFTMIVPPERGVGFRAYDGSSAGPADAEVVLDVRSPRAVQYLASAPSQLGLARAYVAGDLEIIGDAYTALSRLYPLPLDHLTWGDKIRLAREFAPHAIKRPSPPPQERQLSGRRHSKGRDADAIHHHYDVSNRFYSWVLGSVHGLHLRGLPDGGRLAGDGAGGEVRPRLPQARPRAGHAAARRGLRLGRHGHACREALRGDARSA